MTPRNPWRRTWRDTISPILWVLAAAAIIGAAFGAKAHATPQQDGRFLYALGEVGIGYDSATTAIIAGHEVCELLDAGGSMQLVIDTLDHNTQLGPKGSLAFTRISVAVFCGRYGDALRPHLGGNGTRNVGVIA